MLEPLAFAPTPTLVTLLNDFVQNHVFVDDEDEEKDDHSKIQELHKRRNFLASFSKLIIYNVLPTKHGADVFKHYVVFYNHYGKNLTKSLKVIEILMYSWILSKQRSSLTWIFPNGFSYLLIS